MEAIRLFREQLKSGKICLGASISIADPVVADALADSVDFFWIDQEHCPMSPEALTGHLRATRARGVPALVRIRGIGSPFIKPVLDAGADGVIVPQIRSADEVRQVVSDCRYPPLGARGYGPRIPSNYGRNGGRDYIDSANKGVFVSVQIETAEALDALDEIAAVPGVDSLVIGPMDLSGALGVLGDVEHPKVVAAIERVIATAREAGLFVGTGMGPNPDYACVMARRGVQWMHVGNDFDYLVCHMNQITYRVRKSLGSDAVSHKIRSLHD
ncbi:MAG: 2-dehydro-3-deoxyglucarate aldolase [Armatimonadetes bacterium]|nr:2-dehydro-3-deoxyglucarate aldolase [Armatimonadota bacterium]